MVKTNRKKSVLITGAAGGIGRALVEEFLENGYQVIAIDQLPLNDERENLSFLRFDLETLSSERAASKQLKERVLAILSESQLVGLINNAATQIVKPFEDINVEDWNKSISTNLVAPFLLTQLFLEPLELSKGSVVNMSSIHANQTKPEFTVYATSKAALSSLTRLLAIELGSRVRVNAIEPGAIATPMLEAGFMRDPKSRIKLDGIQPMGRIGTVREVAKLALFLIGGDSEFINGATIGIDGGIRGRLHDPI